jgi:hypothetical protein
MDAGRVLMHDAKHNSLLVVSLSSMVSLRQTDTLVDRSIASTSARTCSDDVTRSSLLLDQPLEPQLGV